MEWNNIYEGNILLACETAELDKYMQAKLRQDGQ